MANYSTLKAAINAVIKTNGQKEITGEVLNQVLNAMVTSLGTNYQFAGVATPSTNPGTPDQNVFYLATQAGTYTNFNATILPAGISILLWNGSWSSETFFTVESTPTSGSTNLVTSGGVFEKMKLDGGAYDVSAHNGDTTFASLEALLSDANLNTLIPVAIRTGGMSIRFVQTSDNKYVQYRLMAQSFSTTESDWQGVDDETKPNSKSLIESGAADNLKKYSFAISDAILKNPLLSYNTETKASTISNAYIRSSNGTKNTGVSGFQLDIYAVTSGWYILKNVTSRTNLAPYAFGDSTMDNVTEIGVYRDNCILLYIPETVSYIGLSYYATEQTAPSFIKLNQIPDIKFNGFNAIIGTITGKPTVVAADYYLHYYISSSGKEYTTQELFARTEFIEICGDITLSIDNGYSFTGAPYSGYYLLASDGITKVGYGMLSGSSDITIPYIEGAKYFRFAESFDNLNHITITYNRPTLINDVYNDVLKISTEYKNISVLHNNSYISRSNGIITDSFGNPITPLQVIKPINVKSARYIVIDSSVSFGSSGEGYRFLGENGTTVVSYGYLTSGTTRMQIAIPNNAYYFQMSANSSIISSLKIYLESTDSIIDGQKVDYKPCLYGYSKKAEDVTVGTNASVDLITSSISCRSWLSMLTITGNGLDIELTYGTHFGTSKIKIDATNIIEEYTPSEETEVHPHGLSLGNITNIILCVEKDKTYITLLSNGSSYKTELSVFYGTNGLSIKNNGNSSISVNRALIDYTKEANKDIFLCGDSYAFENYANKYGWTSILKANGCDFANFSYPGASSSNITLMIREILDNAPVKPRIIIYAGGMNDGSDTNNTMPNEYITGLTRIECIAKATGAILIPCTIPSVPSVNNDTKNAYIRQNFSRYLDFDNALTDKTGWASDGSNWITGFLSSDNVHPSAAGFAAMCSQAIMDIPELFN